MFRNILMSAPALAFVLPFVAAQPTMARPLATPVQASLWGDHDDDDLEELLDELDDDDDDDDDDDNDDFELTVCFQTQIAVDLGDDRAYQCGVETGPSCISRCTAEAVAPLCGNELGLAARSGSCVEDKIATCERQCNSDGAAFCSPTQVRWGDHDLEELLDDDDDDDDDDDHGDDVVFIDIETCIQLNLGDDNR